VLSHTRFSGLDEYKYRTHTHANTAILYATAMMILTPVTAGILSSGINRAKLTIAIIDAAIPTKMFMAKLNVVVVVKNA